MDEFFKQKHCDRCGGSLEGGRIMSIFSEECICMLCKDKECKDKDYDRAVKAEHEQIKNGSYNYKGIGYNK